jgi:hypothetical protein
MYKLGNPLGPQLYWSCPILWPCDGETSSHRSLRESPSPQNSSADKDVRTLWWSKRQREREYIGCSRAEECRGVNQPPHCCHGLRTRGEQGEHHATWRQPIHCSGLHILFTFTKPSFLNKKKTKWMCYRENFATKLLRRRISSYCQVRVQAFLFGVLRFWRCVLCDVREKIKRSMNSGNACYLLSSRLLSKNVKIMI